MPRSLAIALLAVVTLAAPSSAATPRFSALLTNGERVEGDKLQDWADGKKQPKIDGRTLLDGGNRMLWMRDRKLNPPLPPKAFVEFFNGDCLSGEVVGYELAQEGLNDSWPAALLVSPRGLALKMAPPAVAVRTKKKAVLPFGGEVRVFEKMIRRIVWQSRGKESYEPGTLFTRDGRSIKFRAVRFTEEEVNLLLPQGQQRLALVDLAELHFPSIDPWQAYYSELVAINPELGPMLTLDTMSGITLTSALRRLRFHSQGSEEESDKWVHGLQPCWSPDVLWVPGNEVWRRRLFSASDPPLSRIWPESEVATSQIAISGRRAQRNRNVQGGSLRRQGLDSGCGLGVQAYSELHFRLPAIAKGFHAELAIDQVAGKGGCVQGRVLLDALTSHPVWKGPFLQGEQPAVKTGNIALPPAAENASRTLILVVDPAHEGRPAGADPFDIRDLADWVEPVVQLDESLLAKEVRQRQGEQFAAWQGWKLSLENASACEWTLLWDTPLRAPASFIPAVGLKNQTLRLSREFVPAENENWFVCAVSKQKSEHASPGIQVRIDGELVCKRSIPQRIEKENEPPKDIMPFAVPLAFLPKGESAKPVRIEVSLVASAASAPVMWHGLGICENPLHRLQLCDDTGEFVSQKPGSGEVKKHTIDRYMGHHSVWLAGGGVYRLELSEPVQIELNPKIGAFQFVQFAMRKRGGGIVTLEFLHRDSDKRPAKYTLGVGPPSAANERRLLDVEFPDAWLLPTRDLHADFGELKVTGIEISVPPGEPLLFDGAYLGHAADSFSDLKKWKPEDAQSKAQIEALGNLAKNAEKSFAMLDFEGRVAGGTIISNKGLILTVGHVAAPLGAKAKVRLHDGQVCEGQTLGISRQHDWALVKLNTAQPLEELAVSEIELASDEPYALLLAKPNSKQGASCEVKIEFPRNRFLGSALFDVRAGEGVSGSALLASDGKLVGIMRRRSDELQGGIFSTLQSFSAVRAKLEKGEVVGDWLQGVAPFLGLTLEHTEKGLRIAKIVAKSPAEIAGAQVGDILMRFGGEPVATEEGLPTALSKRMPGDEAAFSVNREGKTLDLKATLGWIAP